MNININDDVWIVPSSNVSHVDEYRLDFTFINSIVLRKEFKAVIFEIIKRDLLKMSTVNEYLWSIKTSFIPFIEKYSLKINYFSDITSDIADKYIFYLKSRKTQEASTNSLALAAIKSMINHGIKVKLPNYPRFSPFPTKTSRIFGTDDVLKTKYISDEQIKKIEAALDKEENIFIKAATIIAKETGLRISEILTIRYDCLLNDFEGFPILYTYSIKGEDERYVTASQEVVFVIEQLKSIYIENPERYLFFKCNSNGIGSLIKQSNMRYMLKKFCDDNGIDRQKFHAFRHTIGTTMLNNGATGYQVQTQLGQASLHSTSLYAKMKSETVDREYYRMPILGLDQEVLLDEKKPESTILTMPLPDGICKNVIKDNHICEDSYKCLFCNLFRTFKDDLPTHKAHLERIRKDKENYMVEEGVNSFEMLRDIECALETIIERLENE